MATSARAGARRGPVGEKKSEGGYASLSSPVSQARPPPPLVPDLQSRNSLQITNLVLCYGQPAARQWIARAVQTERDGMAGLLVGELAFDVPMGRTTEPAKGRERARGGLVWHGGCNALIPYYGTRVLRTLSRFPARTHCARSDRLAHRASAELRTHQVHCFLLLVASFLLPSCQHAPSFSLVSTHSTLHIT